jgi:hypothetical protein
LGEEVQVQPHPFVKAVPLAGEHGQ